MPRGVSETNWEQAKKLVSEQYPGVSHNQDRFWALVQGVYQRLTKKKPTKITKSAALTPQFGIWEPPGGTHPTTWRRQTGQGKYEYRRARPEEQDESETAGTLFTPEAMKEFRKEHRRLTPAEHRSLAKKTKDPHKRAQHQAEADRKVESSTQRQFLIRDALEATSEATGSQSPSDQRDAAQKNLRAYKVETAMGNEKSAQKHRDAALEHIRERKRLLSKQEDVSPLSRQEV